LRSSTAVTPYLLPVRRSSCLASLLLFFFTDPATTDIYTLSLHDALPISSPSSSCFDVRAGSQGRPAVPHSRHNIPNRSAQFCDESRELHREGRDLLRWSLGL